MVVGERIQAGLVELIVDPCAAVGWGNHAVLKLDDVPTVEGAFGDAVDWNERAGRGNYRGGHTCTCKKGPGGKNHLRCEMGPEMGLEMGKKPGKKPGQKREKTK